MLFELTESWLCWKKMDAGVAWVAIVDVFPGLVAVVFSLSAEQAEDNDVRECAKHIDIILCCSREGWSL